METADKKCRIAILASGEGSNAEALVAHFLNHPTIEVALMVCNKEKAGVYARMAKYGVPCHTIGKAEWQPGSTGEQVLDLMHREGIGLIVLAGFLAYIPEAIVKTYEGRIVNIHPSLLPNYGGKGMWGHHVHEAVKAAGETETGMTVHYVTPVCDSGEMIAQYKVALSPTDTAEDIAEKEHQLEMEYFPKVVEQVLDQTFG